MDWQQWDVDEVVIHEVPQHYVRQPKHQLQFSDQAEVLKPPLKAFFERKVVGSLDRHGFDVERDSRTGSQIPDQIAEIIKDPSKLVPVSKQMAQDLYNAQTGVSPPGLLCVATGRVGSHAAVAVLKVEREEGARVRQQQQSLTLLYLDDLLLTEKTRIFKASVFTLTGKTIASLRGRVADDQRGRDQEADVASFFLSNFLGCQMRVDPRVATRDFFRVTEEFVRDEITDPDRQAHYTLALQARMHSVAKDLRPTDFADESFAPDDRTPYEHFLKGRNINPDQAVVKDTSLIANQLGKLRADYESGLVLLGPSDVVDDRVKFGKTRTVISDLIKGVSGR